MLQRFPSGGKLCTETLVNFDRNIQFNSYSYVINTMLIDVCAIFYILELFETTNERSLSKNPDFWITIGILFFYISSVSFLGIINYGSNLSIRIMHQLHHLFVINNIILYLMFIFAFICRIPIQKYMSNS